MRVGFGLGLGVILTLVGLRIYTKRRHFSQVLIGGGIATFYITGFSAFQLFALVPYAVAMGFMVLVTILAFVIALKQNEAVLSLIGVIGGLATPFLLYTGEGDVPKLIGYTCLILIGTGAVYLFKGWRSLLWVAAIGGWTVLIAAFEGASLNLSSPPIDRWSLQIGVLVAWLLFWALPVARQVIAITNPDKLKPSLIGFGDGAITYTFRRFLDGHLHALTLSSALMAVAMSMAAWHLADETRGWIIMGSSMIYWASGWNLKKLDRLQALAYTHAVVGVVLFTISLCLLLDGDTLFFAIATEVAALHIIGHRVSDKGLAIGGHILFGIAVLWMIGRTVDNLPVGTSLLSAVTLTELWALAVWLVGSKYIQNPGLQVVYRVIIHLLLLTVLYREFSPFEAGQGYVSIAWGFYSIILLIVGLRFDFRLLRAVALGTLLLVVGKLFLVDLSHLETIWRILLFFGFGAVFLVISYFFRAMWKEPKEPKEVDGQNEKAI